PCQPSVELVAAVGDDLQVVAIAGRSPADFAVEQLGAKAGKVVGHAFDRLLDAFRQGQSIRGVQPFELFFAELRGARGLQVALTTPLAALDGRSEPLVEVIAHEVQAGLSLAAVGSDRGSPASAPGEGGAASGATG